MMETSSDVNEKCSRALQFDVNCRATHCRRSGASAIPETVVRSPHMERYECDQCGACCKGSLIIEADDLDVMREPRLIDADAHHRGKSVPQMVYEIQHDFKAIYLSGGSPCAFLNPDNRCSIKVRIMRLLRKKK